jgi:hypothetical protein
MYIFDYIQDEKVIDTLIDKYNNIESPSDLKMDWSISYFNLSSNFTNALTKNKKNNYATDILIGGPEASSFNGSHVPLAKDVPGMYRYISYKVAKRFSNT